MNLSLKPPLIGNRFLFSLLLLIGTLISNQSHAALCTHNEDQIAIYEDYGFTGICKVLNVGWYPDPSMFGLRNDAIRSISVGANVRVTLFEDVSYKGNEALFEGGFDYKSLGTGANDQTSSIIVSQNKGSQAAFWYLGNEPSNRQSYWTEELQGIAHDANYFFITQKNHLRKWPITANLTRDHDILTVPIPAVLAQQGCNHFGDPDVKKNIIFVPVEGCSEGLILALFSTSDLHLVTYDILYANPTKNAAWVAINPVSGELFTSGERINFTTPLISYTIDWDAIYDDQQGHFVLFNPVKQYFLGRRDGSSVNYHTMQGGVFSDDGKLLYLSNSSGNDDGAGLHVFDTENYQLIANSGWKYGWFNFEHHGGFPKYEELEGLDYVNMQGRNSSFSGTLHAILLDNDGNDDDIFIKHYSVFPEGQNADQAEIRTSFISQIISIMASFVLN